VLPVLRWWRVHSLIVAGAPRDLSAARALRYRLSVPVVGVQIGILVMLMLLRSHLRWRWVVDGRGLLLCKWCMWMRMCMMWMRMWMWMGVSSAGNARHDKICVSMVEVGLMAKNGGVQARYENRINSGP